jgi:hypothetical protein
MYERARTDVDKSPFHIFHECFHTHVGLTLTEVRDRNPGLLEQIATAVAAVDGIVRQERRQNMVRSLLKSVGKLKVAITCNRFGGLDVDDNVLFVGKRTVADVAALMANARAVLNCNPSYPSSLHERIVTGMMYGSCVITDVNRCIEEAFSDGDFVPYAPNSSMTLTDLYGSFDVSAVAAAGARKISSDRAYTWDGHIDRLMHAAAA